MLESYSPEEVAAAHLPAEWKDRVRWLKRRLKSGEIPGKRIGRGVYRMTDAHIAEWLSRQDDSGVEDDVQEIASVSIIDGLSARSRARRAS